VKKKNIDTKNIRVAKRPMPAFKKIRRLFPITNLRPANQKSKKFDISPLRRPKGRRNTWVL
jgi:hypothetical protein